MLDLVNGLPVHPLVVHAVVVLVPLSIVGVVALALRPAWRPTYGVLVAGVAALATVLIPVATSSGEALEERVGDPGVHAELGEQLIWFQLPVLVVALVLAWLGRRERRDGAAVSSAVRIGVVVVALVASLACAVQVYRVGDSGARAVWGDQVSSAPAHRQVG